MKTKLSNLTRAAVAIALLAATSAVTARAAVLPAQSHGLGKTYAEWNVAWWQWFLSLPPVSPTGATHPTIDDLHFGGAL